VCLQGMKDCLFKAMEFQLPSFSRHMDWGIGQKKLSRPNAGCTEVLAYYWMIFKLILSEPISPLYAYNQLTRFLYSQPLTECITNIEHWSWDSSPVPSRGFSIPHTHRQANEWICKVTEEATI
jgi:hypothetical protein